MDSDRFDNLTRTLTSHPSRRGVLAGLATGLLTALPLVFGGETATAKKKRKKKKKKKRCIPTCADRVCGDDGCGGSCGVACAGGKSCQGGTCACPSGQTDCGGVCVSTSTDPRNCGSCGKRCQLNASCTAGTCGCDNGACVFANGSCCAAGSTSSCIFASAGGSNFATPANCGVAATCPNGTTVCVGPAGSGGQACCPPGTTCDTGTGTCLQ